MNTNKPPTETPEETRTKPRPVTPELRARVKVLHAEGLGRNGIAKELGIAAGTVTKIAQQHKPPLEFDRASTALAVRARQLDLAETRTRLEAKFLLAAEDSLDMLDGPVSFGSFGGRDNTWNEVLLDAPTFDMRRTLIQSAQTATRSAAEVRTTSTIAGSPAARSMLTDLRDAFTAAVQSLEGVDPTEIPEQKNQPESETP